MYAHSFLYTLAAHTGQHHLSGWPQEFEKYIVFSQIEKELSCSLTMPRAMSSQISPDSRRDFFCLFGLALCLDIFCALVPLTPFVCVQQ